MNTRWWVFALFFSLFASLNAQSPYRFSFPHEAAWTGGGLIVFGGGRWLGRYNHPLTPTQIAALDPARVPNFDRYALRQFSAPARRGSDVLLLSAPVLPMLLLFDKKIRRETPRYALLNMESALSTIALTTLVKNLARRPRPFTYNSAAPLSLKMERDARESFFSGHTSVTAAMSFSTAKIWCDHHPDSQWKPLAWAGAFLVPATTGWLRIRAGKHFPSDVAVGLLTGAFCGWLIPALHRR